MFQNALLNVFRIFNALLMRNAVQINAEVSHVFQRVPLVPAMDIKDHRMVKSLHNFLRFLSSKIHNKIYFSDDVYCGGVKCGPYQKCKFDRRTKREKCVRT